MLATILLLAAFTARSAAAETIRQYYLAVEEVGWDYAPTGRDLIKGQAVPQPWRANTRWQKTRYIEYTDGTFTVRKPQPSWLGILGPQIRAEAGDEIQVHFLNRTDNFEGLSAPALQTLPPGEVAFQSSGQVQVAPGGRHTYRWVVGEESGPSAGEASSVVRWYLAAPDSAAGLEAGLVGPILITRRGMAAPDGRPKDVDREFVLLFKIFDESGQYGKGRMNSINGYIFGNLPGLVARNGDRVRWHILDVASAKDLLTPPPSPASGSKGLVASAGLAIPAAVSLKAASTIRFSPGRMTVTDILADDPGTWLLQGLDADQANAGMTAAYTIVP